MVSHGVLAWVATCATAMLPPVLARAQTAPAQLPAISVEGQLPVQNPDYKPEAPSSPKLTEPLLDTPMSITVIPRQVIQDQGANTLRDTLRNVPGVSLAAGEGGNQGDSLTLRGFSARGDIFLDGMRDFGSYYRDPFNLEAVEALKGPASIVFGRGSTGGVINQVSKMPQLQKFYGGSMAFGTDDTKRVTADVNQPLGELAQGAALRLNVMFQDSGVADRDEANVTRYALAPTLAFGLGTDTRLTLMLYHQTERDVPDYGLPWLLRRPAGVDRSNFYGFKDQDYLRTDADIGTARFEHDIDNVFTIRNQIRYAYYQREFEITEPQVPAGTTGATPLGAIAVTRNRLTGNSVETFLQNQLDLTSKFKTGFADHTLVTGVEVARETSDPIRRASTGVPTTPLLAPVQQDFRGNSTLTSSTNVYTTTLALYGLDTIKLGQYFELIGGLRWDRYQADVTQTVAPATAFDRIDRMFSYRGAVVFKPTSAGSVYFGYGTSFNPSAEQFSLVANTANLPPEESETMEVGTKWDLFSGAFNVRTAVFRSTKTNARTTDPNNATLLVLSGEQEVQGFEVEFAGKITDKWQIFGGYAYLDNEIIASNNPLEKGHWLSNTPKHSLSLWSTYELPWKLQIGGGVRHVSARNANQTPNAADGGNLRQAPGYWVFDAMAKYPLTDNIDLQVNFYNLADRTYYDQLHPSHVVPGPGRSALFTTNFKF